jgi:Zn-dependent protease
MQGLTSFFYIAVLLISVILHEMAHGYAALSQGDKTALYAGRLTFNPLKHLDLWGSFLIPLFLILSGTGFVIGWAKPVPYNPDNLRNQKWGKVWVAVAGVLTNLGIAVFFALLTRFLPLGETAIQLSYVVIVTNIVLAIFNLVPIPPLDGSKIILAFVPARYEHIVARFERYAFIFLILFIFYGWGLISPLIMNLFRLLTGNSF